MGLTDTILQGVETAFSAAGDLVVLGEYIFVGEQQYDPVEENYTGEVEIANVRMIKASLQEQDITGSDINVTDLKFLIPASELATVVPSSMDRLRYKNTVYNVLTGKLTPGDSLWIIYARRG